jgi:dihydrofolate synthase/folylpolyglutamate synthase
MHDLQLTMPHWPKPCMDILPGTPRSRTEALLARLDHPEKSLPLVIHVGGTKGKGSTVAFLRSMLEAAGYRVHVYTSPHLARFNERILLAGEEIGDQALFTLLEEVRRVTLENSVNFFDATTAAALLAFARQPADALLVEMGLGGEEDATRVVTPRLTVLTTLSRDHMEIMGETLPEIAAFEAGIFRSRIPSVSSFQDKTVSSVLEEEAKRRQTPLYAYGAHWRVQRSIDGFLYADSHGQQALPPPSLPGAHQIVNAGNAIAALSLLEEFDIAPNHIVQGLLQARWKGRLELLRSRHHPIRAEIWFDGGHSEAASAAIAFHAQTHWRDKPLYLLFGTSASKDIPSLLRPFAPLVSRLYAVRVRSEPESASAADIARLALPLMPAQRAASLAEAIEDILEREASEIRILIFGSLYLWLEASLL